MARIGAPRDMPPRALPIVIGAVAAVAVGTAVILEDQPAEEVITAASSSFGSEALFRDSFEGDAGEGAPVPPIPPVLACPAVPPGFQVTVKDWTAAWSFGTCSNRQSVCERNRATYARTQSYPTPLGASKGEIVAIPFVAGAADYVNLYFDGVQSRPQVGYSQRPALGMFLGISPCLGDVRPARFGAVDPFERPECRMFESAGSLIWSTAGAGCALQAGETYFLHVMAADPRDGLVPGEHSCADVLASAGGCDVGAITNN